MKRAVRIGILGGSFDPPHFGHLILAEYIRIEAGLKKVVFVPVSQSPNKLQGSVASAAHRLAMTRQAVRGNKDFAVSELEVHKGGVSYTVDTLSALAAEYPGAELCLILGADSFMDFPTWKSPEEIVSMATLLVYPRSGITNVKDQKFARHAEFIAAPRIEISSSMIRRRVSSGKGIRYFVPEAVENFIHARRLYRHAQSGEREIV